MSTVARPPRISVVVPVFDGGEALRRCLESLRAQDFDGYEVIVADDGSGDGSAELAELLADRVIRLPTRSGPGRARNAAAEVARDPVIAFTDADCVLPPDWLSRIDAALQDPALGGVAGGYAFTAVDGFIARFNLHELHFRRRNYGQTVDTAPGANLALRADLFRRIGGFPTDLRYASTEDMVLTLKASREAPLGWLGDNGVGHHFRPRLRDYLRQQFNYARPTPKVYLEFRELFAARSHHPRSGFASIPGALLLDAGLLGLPLAPLLASPAVAVGLVASLAPELPFLRFLVEQESAVYALGAVPLILARNTAWLAGVAVGLAELPSALRAPTPAAA